MGVEFGQVDVGTDNGAGDNADNDVVSSDLNRSIGTVLNFPLSCTVNGLVARLKTFHEPS